MIKQLSEEYKYWERNISIFESYANLGFNELIDTQANMHTMWKTKDFNRLESFIIELSSPAQILSSGTFIPNISFSNEKIFDLKNSSIRIHQMFFNIINSSNRGYIIFSWVKDDANEFYYNFIKSFLNIRTNKKRKIL